MDSTSTGNIDFREISSGADLRGLIIDDRGPPNRSGRWLCPFHDDHTPDLGFDASRNRWRCWACGANGDAIDWLTEYRGMTTIEAARYLSGDRDGPGLETPKQHIGRLSNGITPRTHRPDAQPPSWSNPEWQVVVDLMISEAEDELWSTRDGREALRWLRSRGLRDSTISSFRLGFCPHPFETKPFDCLGADERGKPKGIFVPRGIVIPYALPGSWYSRNEPPSGERWAGANVRRLMPDVFEPLPNRLGKCMEFRGTERGHLYPHPTIEPTQGELAALVVEGEWDALLGWQEIGQVMHVGTIGGTNNVPKPSAMKALDLCPHWLVSTDHDGAGVAAAWEWRERSPQRVRRALLPMGKDLGEFHQKGGNILEWARFEHRRHNWHWPLST